MAMVKCPVCETCKVDSGRTTYSVRRGDTTYFFCEEQCQTRFLEDPDRYLLRGRR